MLFSGAGASLGFQSTESTIHNRCNEQINHIYECYLMSSKIPRVPITSCKDAAVLLSCMKMTELGPTDIYYKYPNKHTCIFISDGFRYLNQVVHSL